MQKGRSSLSVLVLESSSSLFSSSFSSRIKSFLTFSVARRFESGSASFSFSDSVFSGFPADPELYSFPESTAFFFFFFLAFLRTSLPSKSDSPSLELTSYAASRARFEMSSLLRHEALCSVRR